MSVIGRYSDKKPGEVVPCRIDFSRLLGAGETIVSATGKVTFKDGVEFDGGAAAMADGLVNMDASPILSQRVKGGIAGNRYDVAIKVNTSFGYTYEECGIISVKDC